MFVCVVVLNISFYTTECASSQDKHQSFDELEDVLEDQELSSAIGWAIQLKILLVCKEEVRHVKALLTGSFQGCSAVNWSLLVLCGKQVKLKLFRVITFYSCLWKHDLKTYLESLSKAKEKGQSQQPRMI